MSNDTKLVQFGLRNEENIGKCLMIGICLVMGDLPYTLKTGHEKNPLSHNGRDAQFARSVAFLGRTHLMGLVLYSIPVWGGRLCHFPDHIICHNLPVI